MKKLTGSIALTAGLALLLAGCAHTAKPAIAPPAPPPPPPAVVTPPPVKVGIPAPPPAAAAVEQPSGETAGTAATTPTPATPVADPDAAKMPAGPGKDLTASTCSGCHSLGRVVRLHQSRAGWQATLGEMKDNGLEMSTQDLATILDYLTKNYGPAH